MAARLLFLAAGATTASRKGAFPSPGEGLDEGGIRKAARGAIPAPPPGRIAASPHRAAQETVTALGLAARPEDALADIDHGQWAGLSLEDIQRDSPERLAAWFLDPAAGAPGGETMAAVSRRIGIWLQEQSRFDGTILAISHAAVIRAALAAALDIPVQSTFNIDIAPLSLTQLSFNGRWRLQELRPL